MPHLASLKCFSMHNSAANFPSLAKLRCYAGCTLTESLQATLRSLGTIGTITSADRTGLELARALRRMRRLEELRVVERDGSGAFLRALCAPADTPLADPPPASVNVSTPLIFGSLRRLTLFGTEWDLRARAVFAALGEFSYDRQLPSLGLHPFQTATALPHLPALTRLTLMGAVALESRPDLATLYPALEYASLSCVGCQNNTVHLPTLRATLVEALRELPSVRTIDMSRWPLDVTLARRLLRAGHRMRRLTVVAVSEQCAADPTLVDFLRTRGVAIGAPSSKRL